MLKNIYAQLELRFGLLRETTPKYTNYSYTSLVPDIRDSSPAARAIIGTARKAKTLAHIDVDTASRTSGLGRNEIVAKLNDWHDRAFIDLRTGGVVNIYRVLHKLPSTKAEKDKIIEDLYAELAAREQQELDRGQAVIDLVTGSTCFSRRLAQHFGDGLPKEQAECGHCTWCETHRAVQLITQPPVAFDSRRFKAVLAAVPDRDDARYLARVAFGIGSPRAIQAKLSKSVEFGSMEDHEFTVRLHFLGALSQHVLTSPAGASKRVHHRVQW